MGVELEKEVEQLAARFPSGFGWGVAASAYQIEGAAREDGRGMSIWDTFSREPGRVIDGQSGDVATDHYHRWQEDLDLMAGLGVSAYRFSVAWPRILPDGRGKPNERGLDFYERLVDGLLARNIRPYLNLFHWDLPQELQDEGGWADPRIVGWFADYAAVLAGRLGDRVGDWLTMNEPQVMAFHGHVTGEHAPGLRDWPTGLLAAHHSIGAHAAAAAAIRGAAPQARIGIALDINHAVPASASEADRLATERWRATRHAWFLDPMHGRGYPALGLDWHRGAGHLADINLDELPAAPRLDFVGLNYYCRETIVADPSEPFAARVVPPAGSQLTDMGWEVAADGLREVLLWLWREYSPPEIIVSENGAAFPEELLPDGSVADPLRRAYLAAHIEATAEALEAGVPVGGYHVWSLLDNFEWSRGYGMRFGIVRVEYETQRRTIKDSGHWYHALIAAHGARAESG